MAINAAQILEWKRKADQWDALQAALRDGNEVGNGPRWGRRSRRRVSSKGRKSIASNMAKQWAEARRLHAAGKIKAANLKALKSYRDKQATS